jgi:hypothetical protein
MVRKYLLFLGLLFSSFFLFAQEIDEIVDVFNNSDELFESNIIKINGDGNPNILFELTFDVPAGMDFDYIEAFTKLSYETSWSPLVREAQSYRFYTENISRDFVLTGRDNILEFRVVFQETGAAEYQTVYENILIKHNKPEIDQVIINGQNYSSPVFLEEENNEFVVNYSGHPDADINLGNCFYSLNDNPEVEVDNTGGLNGIASFNLSYDDFNFGENSIKIHTENSFPAPSETVELKVFKGEFFIPEEDKILCLGADIVLTEYILGDESSFCTINGVPYAVFSPQETGEYIVTCNFIYGDDIKTISETITVNGMQSFTLSGDFEVGANQVRKYQTSLESSENYEFLWDVDNGTILNGENGDLCTAIWAKNNLGQQGRVSVQVTDLANGCSSTVSNIVDIDKRIAPDTGRIILEDRLLVCANTRANYYVFFSNEGSVTDSLCVMDQAIQELPYFYLDPEFHSMSSGTQYFCHMYDVIDGHYVYNSTDTITYIATKTKAVENAFSVEISPNPVSDRMVLKINDHQTGYYSIRITDISGKTVFSDKMRTSGLKETVINAANLNPGAYILYVSDNEDHIKTQKIIVK